MIEIRDYKQVNQGKKIGFIEVYVPKLGLVYRHLVHLQNGDKRWVNFPTFSYEDGERKHFEPYASFEQNTHNAEFLDKVNEALKKYLEKHNIELPKPLDLSGGRKADECPFK